MKDRKPKPKPRIGPTDRVRDLIVKATFLLARGKPFEQVARELGIPPATLADLHFTHKELWAFCCEKASENIVAIVRATAGTDAVMQDPDGYMRMARFADKWTEARGERLFPDNGKLTLTGFYEKHYLPGYLFDAAESTTKLYAVVLKRWRLVTGNPPLAEITNEMLAKFRDCLMKSRGQAPGSRMSSTSVRNLLRYVCTLLTKAGPPGYRNRDAMDLIPKVPWAKPPREELSPPKIIPTEHLNAVYRAAHMMVVPQVPDIEPGQWWRSFLAVAYNTGLRRRTLFELRWEHVDWEGRRLQIPANRTKSRRAEAVPLNPTAFDHLRQVFTTQEMVFPWPYSREYFHTVFHRLQYDAGIPRGDHFGLHNFRDTLGTIVCTDQSAEAAQFVLGHRSMETTKRRYIVQERVRAVVLARLPQPEAFKNGKENGA